MDCDDQLQINHYLTNVDVQRNLDYEIRFVE